MVEFGIWDSGILWILGFMLLAQFYLMSGAMLMGWNFGFWIQNFMDLCFLAHLLPPRCTLLFHFDSKLEVMSLWLHYSNGLRGSISK